MRGCATLPFDGGLWAATALQAIDGKFGFAGLGTRSVHHGAFRPT